VNHGHSDWWRRDPHGTWPTRTASIYQYCFRSASDAAQDC